MHRTHVGRLHSQDAVPSLGCPSSAGGALQDAEEDQNSEGRGSRDGKRASFPAAPKSGSTLEPPSERLRNRSLSAPHLAWLRSKDKSGNTTGTKASLTRSLSSDPKSLPSSATSKSVRSFSGRLRGASKSRPSSASGEDVSSGTSLPTDYRRPHLSTYVD